VRVGAGARAAVVGRGAARLEPKPGAVICKGTVLPPPFFAAVGRRTTMLNEPFMVDDLAEIRLHWELFNEYNFRVMGVSSRTLITCFFPSAAERTTAVALLSGSDDRSAYLGLRHFTRHSKQWSCMGHVGNVDSETQIYKPGHFTSAASFFYFSKMIDAVTPKGGLRAIATKSDVAILMLNRGMTQSQFMNACIAHAFFCAFFAIDYDHVDAPTRSWKFLNWSSTARLGLRRVTATSARAQLTSRTNWKPPRTRT
jgi:hypothetical protein